MKVELEWTPYQFLDAACRQVLPRGLLPVGLDCLPSCLVFVDAYCEAACRLYLHVELPEVHFHAIYFLELVDKSRVLARAERLGGGVVEQIHILGTADEPVEVIGGHRLLMLDGRHLVVPAHVDRNKAAREVLAGKDAFRHRQHDEILEVEAPGFQHAHHLQPGQGLALEGDGVERGQAVDEIENRAFAHGYAVMRDDVLRLVEHIEVLACKGRLQAHGLILGIGVGGCGIALLACSQARFLYKMLDTLDIALDLLLVFHVVYGLKQVGKAIAGKLLFGDGVGVAVVNLAGQPSCLGAVVRLDDRVGEHALHIFFQEGEVSLPALAPGSAVHLGHNAHERDDAAAPQRVAKGDVDIGHLVAHRVEQRDEKALVGQHDGRVDGIVHIGNLLALDKLVYHLKCIFGLPHIRGYAYYGDVGKVINLGLVDGVGKILDIGAYEFCRLIGLVVAKRSRVVVPAEFGQPFLLEFLENLLLALREHVEARKDVFVMWQLLGRGLVNALHSFFQRPAVVGQLFLVEQLVECHIQRVQLLPQLDVPAFHAFPQCVAVLAVDVHLEDVFNSLFKLRREVVGAYFLQLLHVPENLLGIYHIHVYIVEVAQYGVAPEDEFVKFLKAIIVGYLLVGVVQD